MRSKKLRVFDDDGPAGYLRFTWDHNHPPAMRVELQMGDGRYTERIFLSALLRTCTLTPHVLGDTGVSTIMFRFTAFGCLDIGFMTTTQNYVWVTLREPETLYLYGFLNQVEENMAVRAPLIAADLDWHLKNILASS